jgi:hypothetical protein
MDRLTVAKRLTAGADRGDCGNTQRLAPDASVHMWIDPLGGCHGLERAQVVFACKNSGYFSFQVDYKLASSTSVVELGAPTVGTLLVPAPRPDQDFDFNHDFTPVTRLIAKRKDDCSINWDLFHRERRHSAVTMVSVVTK